MSLKYHPESPTHCPNCHGRNRGAKKYIAPYYHCPVSGDVLLWQCYRCAGIIEKGQAKAGNGALIGKFCVSHFAPVVLLYGLEGLRKLEAEEGA